MYDFSPKTCLIKDEDGQIYNIIDLWQGVKTPVDQSKLKYNYSPKTCLVKNIDGENVNIINIILQVARGTTRGADSFQEIVQARDNYPTLGIRLDSESKKVYDVLDNFNYLPFTGEYNTINNSKIGLTRDMKVEGVTYQNVSGMRGKWFTEETNLENNTGKPLGVSVYKNDLDFSFIKSNTKYTVIPLINYSITSGTPNLYIQANCEIDNITAPLYRINQDKFNKPSLVTIGNITSSDNKKMLFLGALNNGTFKVSNIEIIMLEGDYTNSDLPSYFEGIKSAGEDEGKINILANGVNLFSKSDLAVGSIDPITIEEGVDNNYFRSLNYYNVKNIERIYKRDFNEWVLTNIFEYNGSKTFIKQTMVMNVNHLDLTSDTKYVRVVGRLVEKRILVESDLETVKLYLGTIEAPEYLPYQSNEKTINLPFEGGLKGISNIKDTIETKPSGVYVTQRIGKFAYEEGDELLENCITDKVTSYKPLNIPRLFRIREFNDLNMQTYLTQTHIYGNTNIIPLYDFKAPTVPQAILIDIYSDNTSMANKMYLLEGEIAEIQHNIMDIEEKQLAHENVNILIEANHREIKSMLGIE